jgi:hypothetical protein
MPVGLPTSAFPWGPLAVRVAVLTMAILCAAVLTTSSAVAAPASYSGISADGDAAFFTTTDKLVPGDTDNRSDVYQRSYDEALERHVTRQVSTGPTGGNDAFQALYNGASADGVKVFFSTEESLVAGDTDRSADVYMRNLVENATFLVSEGDPSCAVEACGKAEVDASFAPRGVIPSGQRLFFRSAERLSSDDEDEFLDVYVRDLVAGSTTLVSAGDPACAAAGCGSEDFAAVFRGASEDGTKAFFTTEEQLAAGDDDTLLDIYQHNLTTAAIALVSVAGTCPSGSDCSASYGDTSSDGSHVYFETIERLSGEDVDSSQDVYDWSSGTVTLTSIGSDGGNGAPSATFAGAAHDGSSIVFETTESLLAQDTDSVRDVYERAGGATSLVSTGPDGGNGGSPASLRWVSPDGSTSSLLFSTDESLVVADEDSSQDVYRRAGGATNLISVGPDGGNGAFNASFAGASDEGARVFIVTAEQLVSPGDTDTALDVYEIGSGTTLVSTGPLAGKSSIPAGLPAGAVAADGSHAFFTTEERVTEGDLDAETDVYDHSAAGALLVSTGNSAPLGPPTPSQLATDPASPGESLTPRIKGQSDPNTSIKIYTTLDCSGAPAATGSSLELGGAGIVVTVEAGSTTAFRATATDLNGDTSPCSASVSYMQQNAPLPPPPDPGGGGSGGTAGGGSGGATRPAGGSGGSAKKGGGAVFVTPHTRITFAPAGKTRARRPVFRFTDSTGQAGTSFRCKVDRKRWRACSSPAKLKRLDFGRHVFQVKAVNAVGAWEPAPVKRRFKVVAR